MAQHKGYEIPDELMPEIVKSKLVDALMANPENKQQILAMTKKQFPNAPIPEYDIPQQFQEKQVEPLRKQLAELTTKLEAREAADAARDEWAAAGVSPEDKPEVEKLMVEKGIAKVDTAAEHLKLQRQTAPRSMPSPGLTFQTTNLDAFFKDPKGAAMQEAERVIQELKGGRR